MTIRIHHEEYRLNDIAKQATSALLYRHKGCVILATIMVDKACVEENFLPLSVHFSQRAYAIGRIPGGFNKREGKLSEFETLTSRAIDRSLRPLFAKDYAHPTQITLLVLSHDQQSDLQVCALHAAANALYLANLGIENVAAVRVGRIGGKIVYNPNATELQKSDLNLYVSGTSEALLMVEMHSQESLPEATLLDLLEKAQKHIRENCLQFQKSFAPHRKAPLAINTPTPPNPTLELLLKQHFHQQILEIKTQMAKSEREVDFAHLTTAIAHTLQEKGHSYTFEQIQRSLERYTHQCIREEILHTKTRPDGRGFETIRPISIETNLLPHCHGSALFTRGHTQALVVCTVGGPNDAKLQENLDGLHKERFMFHYNFPPFSVGEATPLSAPGRREIGHGNLAKCALQGSILESDQTIRLVSEILESNGSSSMASVCGGSLALYASGIKLKSLIAGVAMGLIIQGEETAILSDISALEDMQGDMDFKIAGNLEGVVALQMDTKIAGLSLALLSQILQQAKEARGAILECMEQAIEGIIPNTDALPTQESFSVPPKKIAMIIGPSGKSIKEIIERFEVQIELDKSSGAVCISGGAQNVLDAKEYILEMTGFQPYHVEEVLEVEIKKVVDFGIFVRLPRGGDALLHKSHLEKRDLDKDSFMENNTLECRIIAIHDDSGKIDVDLA
ncbi:polyribonucleotide nucleotidyltransferase [Helicobacter felis]|uniref:polyribonucleotide nucleotidyltransferase n=1 Tax=Helicobacter felis TaxID=214 RepID=UPI0018F7EE47|nr:polyribonucleotide nucleotidyltransferase [Helicobacter felis]